MYSVHSTYNVLTKNPLQYVHNTQIICKDMRTGTHTQFYNVASLFATRAK